MKIALVKNLDNSFKIAHPSDYETAKKLKVGETHFFEVKKERNIMFHRKLFALINLVFQNQDLTDDKDNLRAYLTVKAGFYETIKSDIGVMYLPKSISFAKMDEIEFEELFIKFLNVSSMLIGVENVDIMNEISEFL
jgi:hypothetical protein